MKNTSFQMVWEGTLLPRPTMDEPTRNILLIGIGVPNEIKLQWNNLESPMVQADVLHTPTVIMKTPALHEFTHYRVERQERVKLNIHQKTDFIRGMILEEMFYPCKVYSLNNCTDEVRNSDEEHVDEMNINVNHHSLVPTMLSRNWSFDQVIVDHFHMHYSYLSSNISPGFYNNLIRMATSDLFKNQPSTSSRKGEIILPFTPFMFAHVHGLHLLKRYDIRYVENDELDDLESNPLYATTQSSLYEYYKPNFDLQSSNHDGFITHTKTAMLSKEFLFVTTETLKDRLQRIGRDVNKIQFMVLMMKN